MIREAAGLLAVNLVLAGLGAGALLLIGSWRATGTVGALVLSPFTGIALYLALMPRCCTRGSRRRRRCWS